MFMLRKWRESVVNEAQNALLRAFLSFRVYQKIKCMEELK